jgi:hypothetical protein
MKDEDLKLEEIVSHTCERQFPQVLDIEGVDDTLLSYTL